MGRSASSADVARLLVEERLVTPDDLQTAERRAQKDGTTLAKAVLALGLVEAPALAAVLAKAGVQELYDLDLLAFARLSVDQCRKLRVLPLAVRRGAAGPVVTVATSDPTDEAALDQAGQALGLPIRAVLVDDDALERALARLSGGADKDVVAWTRHFKTSMLRGKTLAKGVRLESVSTEIAPNPVAFANPKTGTDPWAGDTGDDEVFTDPLERSDASTALKKARLCCVARLEGLRAFVASGLRSRVKELHVVGTPEEARALVEQRRVDEVLAFEPARQGAWADLLDAARALPRGGLVLITTDKSFEGTPGVAVRRDVPREVAALLDVVVDALTPRAR